MFHDENLDTLTCISEGRSSNSKENQLHRNKVKQADNRWEIYFLENPLKEICIAIWMCLKQLGWSFFCQSKQSGQFFSGPTLPNQVLLVWGKLPLKLTIIRLKVSLGSVHGRKTESGASEYYKQHIWFKGWREMRQTWGANTIDFHLAFLRQKRAKHSWAIGIMLQKEGRGGKGKKEKEEKKG